MKNLEIEMLSYILTKDFMEVQGHMLNVFHIILFYKMVGWFDGQNICVEPRKQKFNPLYHHILCGVCMFVYVFCTCL
jgi:hypothetical protein